MFHLLPGIILVVACANALLVREVTWLPSQFNYLTDMVLAIASVLIVARLISTSNWTRIPIDYVLVFLGFAYVVATALVVNNVEPIVVVAGIRTYFKYVPVFLLPFAITAAGIDLRSQLRLLLAISLVQLPVVIYQRFISEEAMLDGMGRGGISGDLVRGTLTSSSSIAVVCAAAIIMVAAFYIRRHIGLTNAIVIALLLTVPTAIAETKTTPIFLALGGSGLICLLWRRMTGKQVLALVSGCVILLGAFLFSYDKLYSKGSGAGYVAMMTNPELTLDSYNLQGARAKSFSVFRDHPELVAAPAESTETEAEVGRLDSLLMPFDVLWPDESVRLLVGLGIGNVDSSLGPGARYGKIKRDLAAGATTLTLLVWETGLLGALLFCVFTLLITRDAMRLSREEGIVGSFGAGMFGVSLIFLLCLIYTNSLHSPEVMILFVYLGGVVACLSKHSWQSARKRSPVLGRLTSQARVPN